ncbi:hypothetical protein [Nonomuraea sp. NPDC049400]|uniref:hypothetical protein n=1 Tax=Nonomuraea sp. NPDC049400 TaxID=3364352 RepID=UPI0037A81375
MRDSAAVYWWLRAVPASVVATEVAQRRARAPSGRSHLRVAGGELGLPLVQLGDQRQELLDAPPKRRRSQSTS